MFEAVGGPRRGGRLVRYERALEILEVRAVPSTGGEATVEDAPTPQDLGLPSLVDVPVSADMHVSSVLAELFGLQPPFAMLVPLPQFLTPAGTSTVTTDWTGPIEFTNFQVDSEQLNQLAGNIVLPDGGTPYVSPYVQAITIQTASTFDFVHIVFEPIAFELGGVSVVLNDVDMTLSFSDVPGSSLFTGEGGASAISIVSRGIDLFAAGLGAVLQKVDEIADSVARAADSSGALRELAPGAAETFPVARYQLPPTFIDDGTITASIARGAKVDVTARTDATRLLGNLLARALLLENSGYADASTLLARYLRDLLSRAPLQFQNEVSYAIPFWPLKAEPYVYQARVGSFVVPGANPYPPVDYEVVLYLHVDPQSARIQIAMVDQSGMTVTDRRGQDPPGGQVPPKPRQGFGGSVGSPTSAGGGARVQPQKDSRAEKEKESKATKKDDDPSPLPALLSDPSRVHRRSRYAHEEYRGSVGITSGAIGGATIQRKKKDRWAEKENERDQTPRKWDENPLPQVLPDIGLRERHSPRSDSAGEPGEVALRRVPPSGQEFWGQGLTVQILLMVTALFESDCSETFTG